jgi:DNA-binding protein HU-beta
LKDAKQTGLSKAAANKTIDTIVDSIKITLKKGQKVTLVGFGTFSVSKRKARKGRNPQTGAAIKIAAHKVPKFSAGKTLKNGVK